MKALIIVVLLVSWIIAVHAQGYYPLQIGNIWQYTCAYVIDPYPSFQSKIIGDTLLPNGKHYSIDSGYLLGSSFLRQEGSKIYGYDKNGSSEYVILDYSANKGDTLSYHSDGQRWNIAGGKHNFPNSSTYYWIFYEQAGRGNTLSYWTIQDSIGVTAITYEPGISYNLTGYIVNGKLIGTITSVSQHSSNVPEKTLLHQNFPNPFNPTTVIQFSLSEPSQINLKVYNLLGQEVTVIANGLYVAGNYYITWDASQYSSGVYYYRLITNHSIETKKMSFLR